MATKKTSQENRFEQRKRSFLAKFRMYRRRVEYFLFGIPFFFMLFGYISNAIVTKDASHINEFLVILSRTVDSVALHIIPITLLFSLLSLSLVYFLYPRATGWTVLLVTAISFVVIFVIPAEMTNAFLYMSIQFAHQYGGLILLGCLLLLVVILRFRKTRKWFIHTIKYGLEIFVISAAFCLAQLYKTFDIRQFAEDYWSAFVHSVSYMQGFTDVAVLVYLAFVFLLIYSSTISAIRFHLGWHRKMQSETKISDLNETVRETYLRLRSEATMSYVSNQIPDSKETALINSTYSTYFEWPKIGICIPAYNEKPTAPKTLDSVLACDYPVDKREIILVADGSTDGTDEAVIERYEMVEVTGRAAEAVFKMIPHKPVVSVWESKKYPNLKMVVKKNGGKFDALNVGLQYFSKDVMYMSVIDADTTLATDSFKVLAKEAVNSPHTVALAGVILPRDEYKHGELKKMLFTNWQYFDYLCSFHISRGALSHRNAMMIVSGAFGFFDRYMVMAVKGYKHSLGEDIYLTLELQNDRHAVIKYIPNAVAYTQVPTTVNMVRKQRVRWFKGLTEALGAFRRMWIENPRMAVAFAEFFIVEWVTPLLAPYGFATLVARPEMINNVIFQVAMGLAIATPMIQGFVGMCIEASYRKVNWWKIFVLPIQVVMSPFVILWRNDAILDFSSKDWGKMIRS